MSNRGYASGKEFEVTIRRSVAALDDSAFAERLLDSSSYGVRRKYNHEAICDVICVVGGRVVFIEAKTAKHPSSFKMEYVRPNQIDVMLKLQKAGARVFFLFGQKDAAYVVKRVFAVKPSVVAAWAERATIPWNEMADMGQEMFLCPAARKNGRPKWNLAPLFN